MPLLHSTQGFEKVRETVAHYTPEHVAALTGVPAAAIVQAAEWWGTPPAMLLPAALNITPRARENCLACINLVLATGKIGKPGCGYSTITGQGMARAGGSMGSGVTSSRAGGHRQS